MAVYVQYGCGFCAPEGWQNFDVSLTLRAERIPIFGRLIKKNATRFPQNVRPGDIVKGLPFCDGAVHAVWASHVLEHLSRADFQTAIQNTYRILEPGGIFRLIVPDLEIRARVYLNKLKTGTVTANDWFMSVSCLGMEAKPRGLVAQAARMYGGSLHLWMWDWLSIKAALETVGFMSVRKAKFGDSGDRMFDLVENKGRFRDEQHNLQELAVHCLKPVV